MDTIFALASAPGRAGVSVIRISGADAFAVTERLAGDVPSPRRAALRQLADSEGALIDQALVICFPGPASFTGEDVAELHLHGSPAVIATTLASLSSQSGLRQAEPGEFTRRALENGKMDLTQVEGLADLIDAETEAQRRQAQEVLSGHLGEIVGSWRRDLIRAAALLEATIDFVDEDVPVDVTPEVRNLLEGVDASLRQQELGVGAAERVRTGFEIAILGAPNAGKSTLLNHLAGREAAITSEIAGTTRDVIEVRMDVKGLPVTFLDTAGLRDTEDTVEAVGIQRALQRAEAADLRVYLLEQGEPLAELGPEDIVLRAKSDVGEAGGISGRTGHGVPELIDCISDILKNRVQGIGVATRERHRQAIVLSRERIAAAKILISQDGPVDLAAEELRSAIAALDSLLGKVDVENLLDVIFSSFCIGK